MKRIFHLIAIFAGLLAVSCYDDSALRNDMSELSQEVDALRAIVEASENGNVIVSVTEISGGYEIELSSGEKLVIRHGKDGQDGQDGKDGENGQGGSSAFEDVIVSEDTVTFILPDGQEVVIPIRHPLDITFNVADENIYVEGEMLAIEYTITGGTENNRVAVTASGVICDVIPTDANSGYIVAQTYAGSSYVNLVVLVTDGVSSTIFKTVKYVAGVFNTVEGIQVDAEGGAVQVPVQTNMQYEVLIENCDWITVAEGTKAIEVREEYITLNIAPNTSASPRSAEVQLIVEGAEYLYSVSVMISQAAGNAGTGPDPELPSETKNLNAVYLAGTYYGGMSAESGYNYYFVMSTNLPEGEDLPADTYFFAVDLYSSVPVADGENIVPAGKYVFDPDDTFLPGTFSNYYSYALVTDASGAESEYAYTSGEVIVSEDKVELTVTLSNGETCYVVYNGVPDMGSVNSGDGISSLTDDVLIISENAYIAGECYGDYYEVGMNNWMISIYADADTYSGHALMFEILTDGEGIVGEYPVSDVYTTELGPCFLPGEYEVEDGYLYPYSSWYMTVTDGGMDGQAYAPIIDGELLIEEADGIYTIEFDLYDDNNNNIAGILSGYAELYDENGEPMNRQKKQSFAKKISVQKPLYRK